MKFKRIISLFLAACMLMALSATAFAAGEGDERTVIGADLDEKEIGQVYKTFGIDRGSVTELTVTNAEEREYLNGLVDSDVIGTRSISCVYIKVLGEGQGLDVSTSNITWCTKEIYSNALVTAGINDAKIIVTAPFDVSGTAALTGIYKAYENITGTKLDETAKAVGTEEMVVTSELAEEIGSYDATLIVNEVKLMLDQLDNYTDEQLHDEIVRICGEYNVTLNEEQIAQLISLARKLQKMSNSELLKHVQTLQTKLKDLAGIIDKARTAEEKTHTFFENIGSFFSSIVDFFKSIFNS